jgi:Spy/CpxP family protein refolding chaperone
MRTWIKRTLIGIFGATLVFGGLSACSHRHGSHGMAMSEEDAAKFKTRIVERVTKELDLNEQQKQRLVALGERLREQRVAVVGKTTDPRAEVLALVAGPQFDRVRAQAIIEEKTAALRGKSPEVIAAAGEFFDSLAPAQQQKVRDFMQRRRGWFNRG